ncbi:YbaB/EbfC family nucleoid-associated protein [Micromonospora peucetia]|uniref:YbaB/EbfC family nucleoid-associated protein n=1 Tax=Micromonospora peucetia TaxID=47871 RepID=A0ABZ1EDU5_9ACTN|nr:YbaB/EbfC family nucleoid-associated protein [Micromonospora peucetia]WSA32157.1 YbaB/EbfC family nucleoid-associated protein [Micromonospora peucetia]
MWADEAVLDAAARRVDDWEAAFADRARRTRSLTSRIQALTGTARSPDRMVEATVDSSGQLVALRLDERTRQHSATHTSEQIVATARAACADLLRQITEATRETLGDDPAGAAIVESYQRRAHPEPGGTGAAR